MIIMMKGRRIMEEEKKEGEQEVWYNNTFYNK